MDHAGVETVVACPSTPVASEAAPSILALLPHCFEQAYRLCTGGAANSMCSTWVPGCTTHHAWLNDSYERDGVLLGVDHPLQVRDV